MSRVFRGLLARAEGGQGHQSHQPWLLGAVQPGQQPADASEGAARGGGGLGGAPARAGRSLLAPPSSQALAAAGCLGLALQHRVAAALGAPALSSRDSGEGGASGGGRPGAEAPALTPPTPASAIASLGLGLGAAAAAAAGAPAGAALAQLTPNWQRLDSNWRSHSWRGLFGPGRRVTEIIMAANVGMYGLQQLYPGLVFKLARVNHLVSQGEIWRLLTPALIHLNLFHLAANSLSLYFIGPAVEAALGPGRFAAVYAASAVAGNALGWWMGPAGYTLAAGASSSVSGVFGAYVAYRWLNRGRYGLDSGDMAWLAQVVGINVLIQMGSHTIDGWSHLGGALGGAAVVALLGPKPGRW